MAYNYEALLYQLFGLSVVMCHNLVVKIHDLPTTVHNWWVNANQFPKNEPTLDGDSAANCPSYGYTFTHFAAQYLPPGAGLVRHQPERVHLWCYVRPDVYQRPLRGLRPGGHCAAGGPKWRGRDAGLLRASVAARAE